MNIKLPKAKLDNVVVQHVGDETLIYDLTTDQAFCLNETSAKVFEACDGKTSFSELKRKYQFTDDLIHLALSELFANDLLEGYQNTHFAGLSRREAIKKVGLASMIALPVVAGLVAPTAASAASGISGVNQACTANTDCGSTAPQCVPTSDSFGRPQGNRCCVSTADPNGNARTQGSGYAQGAANQGQCDNIALSNCCSGRGTLVAGGNCICR